MRIMLMFTVNIYSELQLLGWKVAIVQTKSETCKAISLNIYFINITILTSS